MSVVRRRGIRLRVTAIAVVTTAIVLAVGAVAVVLVQRRVLDDALDRSLDQRADVLEEQLLSGDRSLAVGDDEDRLAQVVSAFGEVVAASRTVAGRPALAPSLAAGTERRLTISGGDVGGDRFRMLSRGVATGRGTLTLHIGANTDDIGDAMVALSASLALAAAAAVVVVGALVWWLVGRTLRPVERIRTEVADIGAGGLDRRVPVPATSDEIARLAGTMNGMLDRLQDASVRQDRFVADASHELRTPLARLRALIEVQLASVDPAGDHACLGDVLTESTSLQALLDDLFQLARQPSRPMRGVEAVDLDDIALGEVARLRDGGTVVDTTGVSPVQVLGDRRQLARAVQNLLDNAGRHARSEVSVVIRETTDVAVIEVADDGDGVPVGTEEAIFEPFTRLDDARDPNAGHAGLGLAIAREIVTAHDGTVHVERRPAGGAVFVVRLPRWEPERGA